MSGKEQDGRMQNPVRQISFPWWRSQQGSQCEHGKLHDDPFNYFTISCGDEQKTPQPWVAVSEKSAMPGSHPRIELGYSQQMIFAKYPYVDQCYGLFSTYGPQLTGRIMLPISMKTDEGPIYVNAKQYHGIMRRRKSRAKAELENKAMTARRPYLHESRHLHAMRRARGTGGRFLGTKNTHAANSVESKGNSKNGQFAYSTVSINSGSKDTNGGSSLTLSGSEVTSTYPRGDFDLFQINGHHPPIFSLADAMEGGDSMMMPLKWHHAAGNCCNLKV